MKVACIKLITNYLGIPDKHIVDILTGCLSTIATFILCMIIEE